MSGFGRCNRVTGNLFPDVDPRAASRYPGGTSGRQGTERTSANLDIRVKAEIEKGLLTRPGKREDAEDEHREEGQRERPDTNREEKTPETGEHTCN
ncbi:hypothetical protein NDU88_006041 [Pleurodeles waltl]|uniref:Uncharacterized protein n=1 Tax=Pleurodeles waltl TaxID=8319 RepID=A0AAV7VPE5_PLEWA|nr:hypothetical protein NDU88_006041 [Pleurodeles waltl]